MISNFDISNMHEILQGEGDWYSAHVLRFLDAVLFKADSTNREKLFTAFPEHCAELYRHYHWPEDEIARIMDNHYFMALT